MESSALPPPRSERYEVRGVLGSGGMGVVYEAWDRERARLVALKTLHRLDPVAMWRFKREFRAIANLCHPNLVRLHDLVAQGDQWFFTMERVVGVDLHAWIGLSTWPGGETRTEGRPLPTSSFPVSPKILPNRAVESPDPERTPAWTGPDPAPGAAPARVGISTAPRLLAVGETGRALRVGAADAVSGRDLGRLRHAVRGLVLGVQALHEVGVLHRDIKPSNVLVTPEGRVVLLDLGLAHGIRASDQSVERHVAGTAAYMSPEQAAAKPLDAASDWYSVGVVLYEALTGMRPFRGSFDEVVLAKQGAEPPPPSAHSRDVPEDLDGLCSGLLRVVPSERPPVGGILEVLGSPGVGIGGPPSVALEPPGRPGRPALGSPVGRDAEWATLVGALRTPASGPVTVHLWGPSGIGKSTLLRAALDTLAVEDGVDVLLGRVYERESVPFKAVDAVIDALARHLRALSRSTQEAVAPRDVAALTRLFPVLRQVESLALAPARGTEAQDPQEVRRRGFAALRELVARTADRRPLVLAIDDLQWGDLDGASLLADLCLGPGAPRIALVFAYREEDLGTCSVRALRDAWGLSEHPGRDARWVEGPRGPTLELPLGPLGVEGALCLAREWLLGRGFVGGAARGSAEAFVAESGGSPFLLAELCRHAAAVGGSADPVRLEDVLRSRLGGLAPPARLLAELVAVAARPMSRSTARRAAGPVGDEDEILAELRSAHLVRTRDGGDEWTIESYHDRVREAIVEQLTDSARRDRHLRLALALEGERGADPEALCQHFCGAGHLARGGEYALAAAEQARRVLAFERAVVLHRLAERLLPAGANPQALRLATADALVAAGRSREAADLLVSLATPDAPDRVDLLRRAAEQYLRSGHLDEGFSALGTVLEAAGIGMPQSPRGALGSLLLHRGRAWLRGLRWKEQGEADLSPAARRRIDLCWSVGEGLAMIDPIRGGDFQTRHLLFALDAGEPLRVARALVMEAGYRSTAGASGRAQASRLLDEAEGLGRRLGSAYVLASAASARGIRAYEGGAWAEARGFLEQAESTFADSCGGVAWELSTTRHFLMLTLLQQGELPEIVRRIPALVREAEEKGDRFSASAFRNGCMNLTWLVGDDVGAARGFVAEALRPWRWPGYLLQHYEGHYARATIELYVGDGAAAWAAVSEAWPRIRSAQLLSIEQLRLEALWLRGRAALLARLQGGPPTLDRVVREVISGLRRPGVPWALPLADLIAAGEAARVGRVEVAVRLLAGTLPSWTSLGMPLHAAVTRQRLGQLTGGVDGARLLEEGTSWLQGAGVREPARFGRLFLP